MRILIATPLYPPDDGGPATRAFVLEREVPAHGADVKVVSFSKFRHFPKGIRHALFLSALYSAAKNVDVIYALDPVSVGLPAAAVSSFRRIPLVLSIVGDYAWEQGTQRFGVKENLDEFVQKTSYPVSVRLLRFIETAVAQKASRIIVPSQYLKGILCSPAWKVAPEKIVVVYNAFDSKLPPQDKKLLKAKFGITKKIVISVGRFVPWKGFKMLMDAVAKVKESIPDVELYIAGSGDSSEYVAYAKERQYDFVKFLGLLPHNELLERIKAADCFALNTGYEGLSHVILETMALRTPVVTTDVGGNKELFKVHQLHWLARYDEVPRLAEYIDHALRGGEGVEKDVNAAAEFTAGFTEERMVSETISELKRAI